jgi:hypothetical protein
MDKPKLYLETSMFSFYYEERTSGSYPKWRKQVHEIFSLIKLGEYKPYSSRYSLEEIGNESNKVKRGQMLNLMLEYDIEILNPTEEAERLANKYIEKQVLSSAHLVDVQHIAIAVVNGLDYIVSMNFNHLARLWTNDRVRTVSIDESYKPIFIYKPEEVLKLYENRQRLPK